MNHLSTPADNVQLHFRSSCNEYLIESLTNIGALLNQSFKEAHLPQIENSTQTSSINARNKGILFQRCESLLIRMFEVDNNANIKKIHSEETNARGNLNQAHSNENVHNQSVLEDSVYFKDKMLLNESQEMVWYWMKSSSDHAISLSTLMFNEAPTDTDHDHMNANGDVQHNKLRWYSDADYTSDSNIIMYDQYVEDNEELVVQNNVSSVQNDALMSILDEDWQNMVNLGNQRQRSDNSLNKTKQIWKETGKLLLIVGYHGVTGKQVALGKLNLGASLVSGLRLFKTYDRESFKAQELLEKVHRVKSDFRNESLRRYHGQSCFVRDIMGAELTLRQSSTNFVTTISIDDMMKSSPICLFSKASKSKSWLWHRRLNHLNFVTINDLARLCSACQLGKRSSLLSLSTWKKQEVLPQTQI
ncbi:hypothetical protein Tco_0304127 [Tanacetum coccineum]